MAQTYDLKQNNGSGVSLTNPRHNQQEDAVKQEFSIKDLENLTGVKAHTIRIWEQRYNLLDPLRSATNIRTYTGDDLKRLLNVSLLIDRGMKISKVAELSEKELSKKVLEADVQSSTDKDLLAQQRLKVAMMSYDEGLFRETLDDCQKEMGFEDVVLRVCLPFLAEVGVLWLTNAICPAHEHFISNLFRQMLFTQVHTMSLPEDSSDPPVVLYLPEREIHDISLLFLHQVCRAHGKRSIFLGQSVPFDDLESVAAQFPGVSFVTYCTTYPAEAQAQDYVDRIMRTFDGSGVKFFLAGSVFRDVKTTGFVTADATGGALVQRLFA